MHKTWKVQHRIPVPLTPTHHYERHTRSLGMLHWLKHYWHGKWVKARHQLHSMRLPMVGDWDVAARIVQRVWPGTLHFLLSCPNGEGGHGPWVWNRGALYGQPHYGSDAGGWLQYMPGTFASHYASALALARQLHLPVPPAGADKPRAGVWRESPIAQAFAGGWAYFHGGRSAWNGDANCA